MISCSVSWFIAIIISSKSCVTSYEFPTFITKPIQTLYQAPLTALNLLQRTNPLNYFAPFSNSLKDFSDDPNMTFIPHHTRESPQRITTNNKQKEFIDSIQNHPASHTEVTVSFSNSQTMLQNDLETIGPHNIIYDHFRQAVEQLDRKFYQVSFDKLLSISPSDRHENGISFAQSGLFLYLQLMALCTESDEATVMAIKQSLGLKTTCAEQVKLLKVILSTLPESSDFLKFRWTSRFVLGPRVNISDKFLRITAPALYIHVDHLDKTIPPEELTKRLNQMVETDSGGAMHDTFDEEELSNGVCAAWLTTVYLRARWRSDPTALNGSWLFYDGDAPARPVRMIRINDVMRYAHLDEWDAEAIEIRYAIPELTFMILLPSNRSLRNISKKISTGNLHDVYKKMYPKRIAVILPIYTLRMTLLLPGKLEMMGLSRLIDSQTAAGCRSLKLSHAVQRIMFWAEAGRNAFKDDGIEWDEAPELERVVDRPYVFFVRWRNITLLSGNFVL